MYDVYALCQIYFTLYSDLLFNLFSGRSGNGKKLTCQTPGICQRMSSHQKEKSPISKQKFISLWHSLVETIEILVLESNRFRIVEKKNKIRAVTEHEMKGFGYSHVHVHLPHAM